MMGRKRKSASNGADSLDSPIDLAIRIGAPASPRPAAAAPEAPRRVDGPIEPDRGARRPMLIGAESPATRQLPVSEAAPRVDPSRPAALVEAASDSAPVASPPRQAPAVGEMDLVVTPLATPDDWHHFELALRRLPGVGPLRIEYYRAGILKLRLRWSGGERFSTAIGNLPGYRVGILGEDRSTVQIRVAKA